MLKPKEAEEQAVKPKEAVREADVVTEKVDLTEEEEDVLYRGQPKDNKELQTVDKSNVVDNILIGKGIFTTDDKNIAKTYGENVFEFSKPKDGIFDLSNATEKDLSKIGIDKETISVYKETIKNGDIKNAEKIIIESLAEKFIPDEYTWEQVKTGDTIDARITPDIVRNKIVNLLLDKGYNFIKHKGGIRVGDKEHNVYVALKDEALQPVTPATPKTISKQVKPEKTSQKRDLEAREGKEKVSDIEKQVNDFISDMKKDMKAKDWQPTKEQREDIKNRLLEEQKPKVEKPKESLEEIEKKQKEEYDNIYGYGDEFDNLQLGRVKKSLNKKRRINNLTKPIKEHIIDYIENKNYLVSETGILHKPNERHGIKLNKTEQKFAEYIENQLTDIYNKSQPTQQLQEPIESKEVKEEKHAPVEKKVIDKGTELSEDLDGFKEAFKESYSVEQQYDKELLENLPKKILKKSDKLKTSSLGKLNIKPIDTKIKTKTIDDALSTITKSSDVDRITFKGVYYDTEINAKVATNGYVVVSIPQKLIGKSRIVNPKTKQIIEGTFPNYKAIIPKNNNILSVELDAKELMDFVNGNVRANKFTYEGNLIKVVLSYDDKFLGFNSSVLREAIMPLLETGTRKVVLELPDKINKVIIMRDTKNKEKFALIAATTLEQKDSGTYSNYDIETTTKKTTEKEEVTVPKKETVDEKPEELNKLRKQESDESKDKAGKIIAERERATQEETDLQEPTKAIKDFAEKRFSYTLELDYNPTREESKKMFSELSQVLKKMGLDAKKKLSVFKIKELAKELGTSQGYIQTAFNDIKKSREIDAIKKDIESINKKIAVRVRIGRNRGGSAGALNRDIFGMQTTLKNLKNELYELEAKKVEPIENIEELNLMEEAKKYDSDKGFVSEVTPAEGVDEKIEDFGEVLKGAKKFTWARHFTDFDINGIDNKKDLTINKIFPTPDYVKIAEEQSKTMASLMYYAREDIKRTLRKKQRHKIEYIKSEIKPVIDMVKNILNKDISGLKVIDLLETSKYGEILDKINVIELIDFNNIPKDLMKYNVRIARYSILIDNNGDKINRHYSPEDKTEDGKTFEYYRRNKKTGEIIPLPDLKTENVKREIENVIVVQKGSHTLKRDFKTKEDAYKWLEKYFSQLDEKKGGGTKFVIYSKDNNYSIVKKMSSRKYITVKSGFKSSAEARNYLSKNQSALEETLKELKKIPDERRIKNEIRVGVDYTNGKKITPELFTETFGFRGVQFGNWVESKRRQQDLVEAYNGLYDLAETLELPTRALSLNDGLGLAFGARGSGKAMAHYERGQVVINLTKTKGAGSLAHEWFHSLDNYFGKQLGYKDYITDRPYEYSKRQEKTFVKTFGEARKETVEAFAKVVETIRRETKVEYRSIGLDARRTKDYWSTIIEMGARSFEKYIINKLEQKGYSNDYLANIVDYENFIEKNNYPYPLNSEMEIIEKAFDNLFKTLKTKETDKGIALYRKTAGELSPANIKQLEPALRELKFFLVGNKNLFVNDKISDDPTVVGESIADIIKIKTSMNDPFKTATHECIHEIMRNCLTSNEYTGLQRALKSLDMNEEDIAEGINEYTSKYGYTVDESGLKQTFKGRLISYIKKKLRALKRLFRRETALDKIQGFYDNVLKGKYGKREAKLTGRELQTAIPQYRKLELGQVKTGEKIARNKLLGIAHKLLSQKGYNSKKNRKKYEKFLTDNFGITTLKNQTNSELKNIIDKVEKVLMKSKFHKRNKELIKLKINKSTDNEYTRKLRKTVERLHKDKKVSEYSILDVALNKTSSETKLITWNIAEIVRRVEIESVNFSKDFHDKAMKIMREGLHKFSLPVISDYENTKFAKKMIDYIKTGKTNDKRVEKITKLYLEKNNLAKPYIRMARLWEYLATGNKKYIGFAKTKKEIAEVNKALEEINTILDTATNYETGIRKSIKAMEKYDFGVREKYFPTIHEMDDTEYVSSLLTGEKPTKKTSMLKTGKGLPNPEKLWSNFNNVIYKTLGSMLLCPQLSTLKETLSIDQQKQIMPTYGKNILKIGGDSGTIAQTVKIIFSTGFRSYLLSHAGARAIVRNLTQNIAESYNFPPLQVLKAHFLRLYKKIKSIIITKDNYEKNIITKEDEEFLNHLSAKGVYGEAMYIAGVYSKNIPVLRKIETAVNHVAWGYTGSDVVNRKMAVLLFKPLKKLVDESEYKNIQKLYTKLMVYQFHPTTVLALTDLYKQDKDIFFREYVRQKVLKMHVDYETHARPLFMQREETKILSPLLIFMVSMQSNYLEALGNVTALNNTRSFRTRLQSARIVFFKTIGNLLKLELKMVFGLAASTGLLALLSGTDDEDKQKEWEHTTIRKIHKLASWVIPPMIANHIVSLITGVDYNRYGASELLPTGGGLVVGDMYDKMGTAIRDINTLEPQEWILKHAGGTAINLPFMSLVVEQFALIYYNMKKSGVLTELLPVWIKEGKMPSQEKLAELSAELNSENDKHGNKAFFQTKFQDLSFSKKVQSTVFGRETSVWKTRGLAIMSQFNYDLLKNIQFDIGKEYGKKSDEYKEITKRVNKQRKEFEKLRTKVPVNAKMIDSGRSYYPSDATIKKMKEEFYGNK